MKTRTFALLGAVAVLALASVGCKKARSKTTDDNATTSTAEKPPTAPGVTEDKIKIGMGSVFLGPNAGWGTEYYRGSMAYFMEVNSKGGVHGRQIAVVPRDDGYDPPKAQEVFKSFLNEKDTFLLYGAVGTKIVSELVPAMAERDAEGWMQFGNHTGGQIFRDMPGAKYVFNVRPSYRQEAKTLVEELTAAGYKKIGVFHQDDPYGKAGLEGVQRALQPMGLSVVATTTHPLGQKFDVSNTDAIKKMREAGVDAVVCVVAQLAGAGFVRDAREAGWNAPMANFSPVSDTFIRTLMAYEAKTKKVVTNNLINSQVTPALDSDLPAVVEYRTLMDRRNPMAPPELQDANYRHNRYAFSSLEGFLAAKTFVEVLQRTGPDLTRAKFRTAAESLRDYDPGVGATITWAPNSHEGLNKVWLLGVKNGAFHAIPNAKDFLNAKGAPSVAAAPAKATAPTTAQATPGGAAAAAKK